MRQSSSALRTPEERLPSGAPKEEFDRMIFPKKSSLGDRTKVPLAAAGGGEAWHRNVWHPVYIRPSLQLSLTLACIKALSKSLPNLLVTRGVTRYGASMSTCRRRWPKFSMVPQGRFFFKNIRPNSSFEAPEGSLSSGVRNAKHVCGKQMPSTRKSFNLANLLFLLSKCRGKSDLCLCTFRVLAHGESLRSCEARKQTCLASGKIGICHSAAVLHILVPKECTDINLTLFYILIARTHSKFVRKYVFLAFSVFFP